MALDDETQIGDGRPQPVNPPGGFFPPDEEPDTETLPGYEEGGGSDGDGTNP